MDIKSEDKNSATAVENAQILLPFVSRNFGSDSTCVRLLQYAADNNIEIIPILCDNDLNYTPSGAIGLVLAEFWQNRQDLRRSQKMDSLVGGHVAVQ